MYYLPLSLWFSLVFIILQSHAFPEPKCHPDERSSLLSFNPKNTWNTSEDCCTWDGVECDVTFGHVIGLDIDRLQANVTENTALFSLRHLRKLTLTGPLVAISESGFNSLSRNLTELEELKIVDADMSSVPLVSLSNLSPSLTSLDLERTRLHGEMPGHFFQFPNLINLTIFGESSIRVSESLSINPTNLSFSEAAFDSLSQNSTKLRELTIHRVDMSSVPLASFANLSSSLTILDLENTALRGDLPPRVFHFPKLEVLRVIDDDYNIRISEAAAKALVLNSTNLVQLSLSHVKMPSLKQISLANFSSSLIYLGLGSCLLNGGLPDMFFTSFPKLEFLELADNNLTDSVPEFCSNPSNKNRGNFSSNCLLGSPPNLFMLGLVGNSIHGPIPTWIFELPHLEFLALSNNHFSGEIGDFRTSSLMMLSLVDNQLQGVIPRSLFQQTNLLDLNLASNNLTGIVEMEELSKLQNLTQLELSFNNLTLSFNNSKDYTTPNLFVLRLASCNIPVFPRFLESMQRLAHLDLSNNQIKGSVPTWFWDSHKYTLQFLILSHNSLTYIDPFPWYNLEILDLHSNSFAGPLPIPSPFSTVFLASKNNFSGEIPTFFCNMGFIQVVDFSFNNLSGEFPHCMGNSSEYLSVLDLRHNNLRGSIATTFAKGNQFRSLNLNGNQLEGTIPRSLVNCSNLEVLDLGNNLLNDTFPDWLESLPMLQVLVLRANRFHGSIGDPMPGTPFLKLRIMDLSQNQFAGDLPSKYFESFKAMQTMDKDKVKMEYMGQIFYQDSVTLTMKGFEFELVRILTIFTAIDFSSNNFSGKIPENLGKLVSLKGLNLSHNMLVSTIPPSLGDLSNLEWLDLSSNELVGEIPDELVDVTFLSFLNLSYNHLEGPIPHGKQFDTFDSESFKGNMDLCGFQLSKSCNEEAKPSTPSLEQDEDDDSSITNGFNWRIVMMGYASGCVIGISIGYMLLSSNGKLRWRFERIVVEFQYNRARRPKRRNAGRSTRRA